MELEAHLREVVGADLVAAVAWPLADIEPRRTVRHRHAQSTSVLARMLGDKSPIFDIEHLQLFSEKTIRALLQRRLYRYPGHARLESLPNPLSDEVGASSSKSKKGAYQGNEAGAVGNDFVFVTSGKHCRGCQKNLKGLTQNQTESAQPRWLTI